MRWQCSNGNFWRDWWYKFLLAHPSQFGWLFARKKAEFLGLVGRVGCRNTDSLKKASWLGCRECNLKIWSMKKFTGWWFQFFYFHPYLGKISNLTNIFQTGWKLKPPTSLHMYANTCFIFQSTLQHDSRIQYRISISYQYTYHISIIYAFRYTICIYIYTPGTQINDLYFWRSTQPPQNKGPRTSNHFHISSRQVAVAPAIRSWINESFFCRCFLVVFWDGF